MIIVESKEFVTLPADFVRLPREERRKILDSLKERLTAALQHHEQQPSSSPASVYFTQN